MAFLFLLLYVVIVLIRPQEWTFLGLQNVPLVQYALLACLLGFPFVRNKNLTVPLIPLMVLFTIIVSFSLIASIGWFGGAITYGQEFIQEAFIPFLLISVIVGDLRKQYAMFIVISLGALFMVLNGHVQISSQSGLGIVANPVLEQSGGIRRITYLGILGDPNDLGMFLVMVTPTVFLLKGRALPFFHFLYWAALAAIFYGIYLTNSRGTLVSAMALVFFWFYNRYGTSKTFLAIIIMSPILLFIISGFRGISIEESSAQGRFDAWYSGYQMFISSPFFGVGYGGFTEWHPQTAHNSFVLVFSELGIIGLIIWVALLASAVIILLDISKKRFVPVDLPEGDPRKEIAEQESRIATALLYSLLAFMVSGFFLSRSYNPILYIYLGMAAATIGRVVRAFPGGLLKFDYKKIAIWTFSVAFFGMTGIYVLVKIGL